MKQPTPVEMELRIVRRQLTFARKRIRKMESERRPEVLRVIRWARRYVRGITVPAGGDWNLRQLQRAVRALAKLS